MEWDLKRAQGMQFKSKIFSFGAIFNFVTLVTKRIRKEVERSPKPLPKAAYKSIKDIVIIAETALVIIASQLVILGTDSDSREELSKEYESTLHEIDILLRDVFNVWGSSVLEDSLLFVHFLQQVNVLIGTK